MTEPVDFSPLAAEYEQYRVGYGDGLHAAIAQRIASDPQSVSLDVACGTGLSTIPLRHISSGLVIGTDVGTGMIQRAPQKTPRGPIVYVAADALSLPFRDGRIDTVTCAQAMHWITHDPMLKEVKRILRPGGWFFAYWKYPAPDEPYQALAAEILSLLLGRDIRHEYSLKAPPMLAEAGFVDVTQEVFSLPVPFTVASYTGFMRSRRRIRDLAGDRTGEFLKRFEAELSARVSPGAAFVEMNEVLLFGGRRP